MSRTDHHRRRRVRRIAEAWPALDGLRRHPEFERHPLRSGFRLLEWALRSLVRRDAVISLSPFRSQVRLAAARRSGALRPFLFRGRNDPEMALMERALGPGSVVVDAGANVGLYTLIAAELVGPEGAVLAFEPGARSYERLSGNVALNGYRCVEAVRVALSDRSGTASLHHVRSHPSFYSLGAEAGVEGSTELVETRRLDDLLAERSLARLDLLKLDVEGAEELVLRGAAETLARFRPVVFFEIQPPMPGRLGLDEGGAWEFLRSRGYELAAADPSGGMAPVEVPAVGNNVAVPVGEHS